MHKADPQSRLPRLLLCHNYYLELGGECLSYQSERDLLKSAGYEVIEYTRHNSEIADTSSLKTATGLIWNRKTYKDVRRLVREHRIDVVHCTNTFPLISASVYSAARKEGAAVVQALRNFRFLCAGTFFSRDASSCELCLGSKLRLNAIRHRCYRGGLASSAVVVASQITNDLMSTWEKSIDLFYSPSAQTRDKYIEAGFPKDRLTVKPNFLRVDPGMSTQRDGSLIYVGRISKEKGVKYLLEAWHQMDTKPTLRIVGDGALRKELQQQYKDPRIEWLGFQEPEKTLDYIGRAAVLVMPSIWNETFGRTVMEAYAKGTPVVASDIGAMKETVLHGKTGLLVEPANAKALAESLSPLLSAQQTLESMSRAARREFETKYTSQNNLEMLHSIYMAALQLRTQPESSVQLEPTSEVALSRSTG